MFEGQKRSRSQSSSHGSFHNEKDGGGEVDTEDAALPIPFLTTLCMNQRGLFYGRKDVRRGFADASTEQKNMESAYGDAEAQTRQLSAVHSNSSAAVESDKKVISTGISSNAVSIADDTTLLHSMLEDIMEAAVRYCAIVPHATSAPPSASLTTSREAHFGDTLPACAYLLRTYFRFTSGAFKPHQQEVCFSILGGQNTLAVCPTGWGKSLCYQFPMLVHRLLFECRYERWCRQAGVSSFVTKAGDVRATRVEKAEAAKAFVGGNESAMPSNLFSRFCVVVSPLLALMEDQAEKINSVAHLSAFVLSSKVDADREARLYQELASPLCALDVLFVSPEKFITNAALRRQLQSQAHRLAMLCVDEVHCVSGWAYDFRPTYMYVSRVLDSPLLDESSNAASPSSTATAASHHNSRDGLSGTAAHGMPHLQLPCLCLTATATSAVIEDIQASFHIQRTVLCADQRRENLELQVVDLVARHAAFHHLQKEDIDTIQGAHEPSPRVVQDALVEAVQQLPKPMLIYVQSRADADELSGFLSAKLARGQAEIPQQQRQQQLQPSLSSLSLSGSHSYCNDNGAKVLGSAGQRRDFAGGVFHATRYTNEDMEHGRGNEANAPREVPHRAMQLSSSGGLVVRCYHAALTRAVRTATQRQFLENKIDVLVATVAFGMGIDKANIRSVVHASAPGSLEGYVQEIGRAGRDGASSVCRVLYNPFDFYALRSRLWASLLSPAEMHSIVKAVLSGPTTHVGQRLMLVSTSALSTELGISEEAIETVVFLLLTEVESASLDKQYRASVPLQTPFHAVLGSYPLRYKILSVQGEAERGIDPAVATALASSSSSVNPAHGTHRAGSVSGKRRRAGSSSAAANTAGVGLLLQQLGATDAVLELCRVMPSNTFNQIEMANRLAMPLAEFQQRMQDLVQGGAVTVARYGVPSALLIEVADSFAEAASPAGIAALSDYLWSLHRRRLNAQESGLRRMFRVLAHPTHDAIAAALRGESLDAHDAENTTPRWSPPARGCGKMRAVSIANAFVEENRLRLHSTYEALRALMGIRPKSLIHHGKYAGQLPLAQSWYVSSPYFGALRTFDLAWVLQILAPHQLDSPVT
jgi:ATP-dependent DNA helicase RecQ